MENWIQTAGADYVADSWDELKFIRQVSKDMCFAGVYTFVPTVVHMFVAQFSHTLDMGLLYIFHC